MRRARDVDVLTDLVVVHRDVYLPRRAARRSLSQRPRHRRSSSNIQVFSVIRRRFSPRRKVQFEVADFKEKQSEVADRLQLLHRYHRHATVRLLLRNRHDSPGHARLRP